MINELELKLVSPVNKNSIFRKKVNIVYFPSVFCSLVKLKIREKN